MSVDVFRRPSVERLTDTVAGTYGCTKEACQFRDALTGERGAALFLNEYN